MTLVAFFNQANAGRVSLVGGKGSNLIALTTAGFPVPPGFVITAEAYGLFLDHVAWLDQELAALPYDQPDRLQEQCTQLRERLCRVDLPAALHEAIHQGLAQLGADQRDAFAVRSSSTFEDLAQA